MQIHISIYYSTYQMAFSIYWHKTPNSFENLNCTFVFCFYISSEGVGWILLHITHIHLLIQLIFSIKQHFSIDIIDHIKKNHSTGKSTRVFCHCHSEWNPRANWKMFILHKSGKNSQYFFWKLMCDSFLTVETNNDSSFWNVFLWIYWPLMMWKCSGIFAVE